MKFSSTLASIAIAMIGFSSAASALSANYDSSDLAMRELESVLLEARYLGLFDEDFEYSRDLDFDEDLFSRYFDDDMYEARDFADIDLYDRDYQELMDLETRNPAALVRVAVQGIKMIVNAIKNGIQRDKDNRSKFTVDLVGRIRAKYPGFNVVVCHTKHETKFEGTRGKDWGHMHEEFDVKIGGTVGYEIYYFKKGTFIRRGDGGYLNWAYAGNVIKTEDGGKRVTFG